MKRKRYPEDKEKDNKKNKYKQRQDKNDITSKNKEENKIVTKSIYYYIKNVRGDGNCYFRCISYYFRESELFYNEYRQLIYELFILKC